MVEGVEDQNFIQNSSEPSKERSGIVPNEIYSGSEPFRTEHRALGGGSERTPDHTITIREAARMFEEQGVPRTERGITKWCHANAKGIKRLNCFLDPAENKFFLTPQSIYRVIGEEKNKGLEEERLRENLSELYPNKEERSGTVQNIKQEHSRTFESGSEQRRERPGAVPNKKEATEQDLGIRNLKAEELEGRLRDAEIASQVKEKYIERLHDQIKEDRGSFDIERQRLVGQLVTVTNRAGLLEGSLLALEGGKEAIKQLKGRIQPSENNGHDYVQNEADPAV